MGKRIRPCHIQNKRWPKKEETRLAHSTSGTLVWSVAGVGFESSTFGLCATPQKNRSEASRIKSNCRRPISTASQDRGRLYYAAGTMILAGIFGGILFVLLLIGDWYQFTSLRPFSAPYGFGIARRHDRLDNLTSKYLLRQFGNHDTIALPHGVARKQPPSLHGKFL